MQGGVGPTRAARTMSGPFSLLTLFALLAAEPAPEAAAPPATPAAAAKPVAAPRLTETVAPALEPAPVALQGSVQGVPPAPRSALVPEAPSLQPDRSWLLPLVEVPALNLAIFSFDRFVLRADWAQVSPASIRTNLGRSWVIDSDDPWVNFVGHPFHGTLAFNAARSSGLTFWESLAFPLVSSMLWEVAGETVPPSLNDQLLTSASGVFMGEVFHRTAQLLLDGAPGPLEHVLAVALSPLGGVNRHLFGRRDTLALRAPHEARLLLGGTGFGPTRLTDAAGVHTDGPRAQPYAGVELVYGFPGEPGASLRAPFDHFQLQAGIGAPGALTGEVHLRGLIAGWGLGTRANDEGPRVGGAWGLFGSHDFGSGPGFRVATTALGLGTALQTRVGAQARLRTTGVLSGVILGAAGTFGETDTVDTGPLEHALYSIGPGAQALVDVELAHPTLGSVGLTGRAFRFAGVNPGRGWERVDQLSARGMLRVAPGHQVGAEVQLGRRHADAGGGVRQGGALGRVFWAVELGR